MGWGKLITKTVKGSGRILGGGLKYGSGAFGMYASGNAIYQYAANDKGALDTWGNMFLGKDTMNKVKTEGAGEVVGDFFLGEGNTDKVIEKGKDLIGGVGDAVGSVKEGGGGLFGSLGNMISGLFSGGTSSLVGLIAAGMMLFGNFGWMGKIVCGLIAAMSFGMFGGNSQQVANQQQTNPALAQPVDRQQTDYDLQLEGNDEGSEQVVYRPRR